MKTKQDIVNILIKRDGLYPEDAQILVDEVQATFDAALHAELLSHDWARDLLEDELQIEPDYIEAFLPF